jgi:hypothetical protein
MTTFKFLCKYIRDEAIVSIVNDKGSIKYCGKWLDMPFSIIAQTEFVSIDGLGSENDLIITVTDKG